MAAIAETTLRGEARDVVEGGDNVVGVGVQAQRAQARRVDQAGAAGQRVQCAHRRRVTTAAVATPRAAGVLHRRAEQRIGERALARAARAHHHQRLPGTEPGGERLGRAARQAVDCQHGDVCRHQRLRLVLARGALLFAHEVGLGQHHHRADARQAREGNVALEPARVEIVVQTHHDQHRVDVGHDHHARDLVASVVGAARDLVERRHASAHPPFGVCVALGQHPVADGDRISVGAEFGMQRRQQACTNDEAAVVQHHAVALDLDHAHQRVAVVQRGNGAEDGRGQADGLQPRDMRGIEHGGVCVKAKRDPRRTRERGGRMKLWACGGDWPVTASQTREERVWSISTSS